MRQAEIALFPVESVVFPAGNVTFQRMHIMKRIENKAFPGFRFSFPTVKGSTPAGRLSFTTVFVRWRAGKKSGGGGECLAAGRQDGLPWRERDAADGERPLEDGERGYDPASYTFSLQPVYKGSVRVCPSKRRPDACG